jgi:uncharacterized membrane protein (DUF485 family)
MIDPVIIKIQNHPKYKELRDKRQNFGMVLTILMLIVYGAGIDKVSVFTF